MRITGMFHAIMYSLLSGNLCFALPYSYVLLDEYVYIVELEP
jgi:hypothetical protein